MLRRSRIRAALSGNVPECTLAVCVMKRTHVRVRVRIGCSLLHFLSVLRASELGGGVEVALQRTSSLVAKTLHRPSGTVFELLILFCDSFKRT